MNVEVNVELLLGPGILGADGVRLGGQLRELLDDPNGLPEGLILNEYVELFDISECVYFHQQLTSSIFCKATKPAFHEASFNFCHIIFLRPFCKGVLTTHTQITSRADDYQIMENSFTTLRFWYIMPAMEIEHCYFVLAPGSLAFSLKRLTHIANP